jgi:hypothetical protein
MTQLTKIADSTYFITPGPDHSAKVDGEMLTFLQEQLKNWQKSRKSDSSIPVQGDILLLLLEKIQDLSDRVVALEGGTTNAAKTDSANGPAMKSESSWASMPAFRPISSAVR